jgi:hypothetical protein
MEKGQLHRAAGVSNLFSANNAEPQPQRVKANERLGISSHAPFAADPLRLGLAASDRGYVRRTSRSAPLGTTAMGNTGAFRRNYLLRLVFATAVLLRANHPTPLCP